MRTLVLGPGGVKGYLILGALSVLDLSEFNTFVGVSVGSIIACLLCCGFTVQEIFEYSLTIDNFFNFDGNIKKLGITSNRNIKQHLESFIKQRLGMIPTFEWIYKKYNKKLVVVSLNISKDETVYFSHTGHPNLKVLDAVLLSINIPLVFEKITLNGDYYVDGALGDPYPIYPNAVGISISSVSNKIDNPIEYISKVLTCSITQMTLRNIASSNDMKHIRLVCDDSIPVKNLTTEEKTKLFNMGRDQCIYTYM